MRPSAFVLFSLAGFGLFGQPAANSPAFEVASIKPNKSGDHRQIGMQFLPGGRFTATNVSLHILIAEAYDFPFQSPLLTGGPDWVRSERYDIQATAEKDAIPVGSSFNVRHEKMRLMLRTLLADRFKLTIHREMKEMQVWALVVAKHGPKLQKAKIEEKDCPVDPNGDDIFCHGGFMGGSGRGLHGEAEGMRDLVSFLPFFVDRPIVDRTGIEGIFDINTDGWAQPIIRPDPAPGTEPRAEDLAASDPNRRTLFTVLEEQLGLKLESQKAPVEVLVIDSAERPSAN